MKKTVIITAIAIASHFLCIYAQQTQAQPNTILKEARMLAETKQFELSVQKYAEIENLMLSSAELAAEWARALFNAARYNEAAKIFESANIKYPAQPVITEGLVEVRRLLAQPKPVIETYRAARDLANKKHYSESMSEYYKIKDFLRGSGATMIEWLRTAENANEEKQVLDIYTEIIKSYPAMSAEAAEGLGEQYRWERHPQKAAEIYTQALHNSPTNQELRLSLAQALSESGEHAKALEQYVQISGYMATTPDRALELARAYSYAGKPQESIAIYEDLLKNYPRYGYKFLKRMGDEYKKSGQPDKALAIYREAASIYPKNPEIKLALGRTLVEKKDYKEALGLYNASAEYLDAGPDTLTEWARVAALADKPDQAVLLFEKVRKKYPERGNEILAELAAQYRKNHQLAQSAAAYRRVLLTYPKDRDTRLALARTLAENADYSSALEEYKKLGVYMRSDPDLLMEWARSYILADRPSEAISLFEEIKKKYPARSNEILKDLAEQFRKNGQLAAAIATYNQALQVNPNDIPLRLGLARTLAERKSFDEALDQYSRIDAHIHSSAELMIELAKVNILAGKFPEVLKIFAELKQSYPASADAILKELADNYKKRHEIPKAIATYRQILQNNPQDGQTRLALAQTLATENHHEEALVEFAQIPTLLKSDPKLFADWARTYAFAGHPKEAVSLFEAAKAAYPGSFESFAKELAEQYRKIGRQKDAVKAYSAILKKSPNNIEMRIGLARTLVEMKDYKKALDQYEAIGSSLKSGPGMFIEWARVYTYDNQHAQAIAMFEEIRKQYPGPAKAIMKELAHEYKWNNQPEESLKTYRLLLKESPADTESRMEYARFLVERKNYNAALEQYAIMTKHMHGSADLLLEWSKILALSGHKAELIVLLEDIQKQYPDRAEEILRQLAELYRHNGQYDKAAETYLIIVKHDPKDAETRLDLARVYVEQKDYAKALEQYNSEYLKSRVMASPDLIIEIARVYTYANRHGEAIALFETIKKGYAPRFKEVAREMGDQYRYNNQPQKAIDTYIIALKEAPQNKELRLALARFMVELGQYNPALDQYSYLAEHMKSDPGLFVEWTRVYTYADRHAEAIAGFEEIRRKYPDRENEILKQLADQYKWSGKLDEAITTYRLALQRNPADTDARFGLAQALAWSNRLKEPIHEYEVILSSRPENVDALNDKAEVVSWMDNLEDAYEIYGKSLAIEPTNLKALNGQARMLVWQGKKREGIARYEAILAKNPTNQDALIGEAYAQHWQGREDKAAELLNVLLALNPKHKDALKLYDEIKNWQKPYVNQFNRYSYDKNLQSVNSNGIRAGARFNYSTGIEAIYERSKLDKNSVLVKSSRYGVGLNHKFNEQYEINSFLYKSSLDGAEYAPFTTNTWFTYLPNDILRFDLAYDREIFEDSDALVNKVITNNASLSMDVRPNRLWLFSGKVKKGSYSDTNGQTTTQGRVEYRLARKPYTVISYNYYRSTWDKLLYNGYFNPNSVTSHSFSLHPNMNLFSDRLNIDLQGSAGYEMQNPTSDHPTYYAAAGLSFQPTKSWILTLRADLFDARPDSHSNGYYRRSISFGLVYLGLNPPKLYEAAGPSRASGR